MGLPAASNLNQSKNLALRRAEFTEKQIAFSLRLTETGTRLEEVCITGDFFNLIKKCEKTGFPELHRRCQLEKVNARIKKLVADSSLDRQILQAAIKTA